jgi:hypothetical protein
VRLGGGIKGGGWGPDDVGSEGDDRDRPNSSGHEQLLVAWSMGSRVRGDLVQEVDGEANRWARPRVWAPATVSRKPTDRRA